MGFSFHAGKEIDFEWVLLRIFIGNPSKLDLFI